MHVGRIMPAHGDIKDTDKTTAATMLGVQSRKEPDARSLDSKIARNTVTSSMSDGSTGTGRYATVQGSRWFRDKSVLTGSDTSKGGTPSAQGTSMKPVALVTSVQGDVANSSAQESGEHWLEIITSLIRKTSK